RTERLTGAGPGLRIAIWSETRRDDEIVGMDALHACVERVQEIAIDRGCSGSPASAALDPLRGKVDREVGFSPRLEVAHPGKVLAGIEWIRIGAGIPARECGRKLAVCLRVGLPRAVRLEV